MFHIYGQSASLECLRCKGDSAKSSLLVIPKATVFWARRMSAGATRSVYFTSVTDESGLHDVQVSLRNFELEPHVILEKKLAAERRDNIRRDAKLMEKPKGVDIALAVRMLEDARNQTFDRCHLYTSDADFLPVIEALMAQGKGVSVFGYKAALADRSKLLHVPDQFVDLGSVLESDFEFTGNDRAQGQV